MKINLVKRVLILAMVVAFAVAGQALAAEKAFKEFHTIVEADFVKKVADQKEVGIIIDARPKIKKYDKGHIPGAINMPTSQFEKAKGLLPADKNALIIFYCEGLKCALSHKSAYMAEKLGYKNVKVYAKGYPHWKKTYGPGPGDPELAAGAGQVIVIEGGKNTKKIMDYIESEGLMAASAGPVQTGMFKPGKEEGSIDHDVFKQLAAKDNDKALLIDNRDAAEYKKGSINGAENIPVEDLEKMLAAWKPGKPVVFFCGTGARSGEAYYMVKDMRPDLKEVYYVDGEFTFDGKGGFELKPAK